MNICGTLQPEYSGFGDNGHYAACFLHNTACAESIKNKAKAGETNA
jgi:hypothetical protein